MLCCEILKPEDNFIKKTASSTMIIRDIRATVASKEGDGTARVVTVEDKR